MTALTTASNPAAAVPRARCLHLRIDLLHRHLVDACGGHPLARPLEQFAVRTGTDEFQCTGVHVTILVVDEQPIRLDVALAHAHILA